MRTIKMKNRRKKIKYQKENFITPTKKKNKTKI